MPLPAACRWIDQQLPSVAIDLSADASRRMASIKAIGDLSHAGDVLERSTHPDLAAIGRRWMDRALAQLGGGERIRELIAASPLYAPAAVTFLPLHLSGRTSPALRDVLASRVRSADLPPLAWTMLVPALEMLDIEPSRQMALHARQMSVLAHRTPPALLPADAVYVLAHECMYETRWGRRPPRWDDATAAYVARALPELVTRFAHDRDADVLAELIVAVHATLGRCVDSAVWDVLADAQSEAGNVEPPPTLVTMFPRLPHPVLTRTYHTTIVAIMAWASCAHHDLHAN